jgi:hypothetical protein
MLNKSFFLSFFMCFSLTSYGAFEPMLTIEKYVRTVEINADGTNTETEEELDRIETEKGVDAFSQSDFPYIKNMQSLEILDAYTVNPSGKKIKVTKEGMREKEDSLSDGADSFSDIKHKIVIFPNVTVGSKVYAKTRLKTFKTKFKNHFYLHSVTVPYRKTLHHEINLIADKKIYLNFDAKGFNGGLVKETKNKLYYKYTYSQDSATAPEDNTVSLFDFSPYLLVSSFKSYEEFGAAYQKLNFPKTKVTPYIQGVADGIINQTEMSKREEAKLIYEWVVKNIRYVAVYVGNGGIEGHSAEKIIRDGYGDCKDHSIVLEALLRARGIESSFALINLGIAYKLPPIPVLAPQNHVITYLPDFDIYLDSTSQFTPFGMLPYSDLDKPTVLTGLNKIGHTPKMSHLNDAVKTKIKMKVNPDGTISGESSNEFKGFIETSYRIEQSSRVGRDDETIVTDMLEGFRESGVGTWKATDPRDLNMPYKETTTFTLDPISNFPGPAAMAIPVGLTQGRIYAIAYSKPLKKRNFPYQCFGKTYEDDYEISFPEKIRITRIPTDVNFSKDGLTYIARYQKKENTILINRKLIAENESMSCKPEKEDRKQEFYKVLQRDIRSQIFYE